ncbi:hypothetical protein COV06_00560 [Candidatus Uhrbacteria bacterium CG10_big_fil_rev_8_21_14_0_10_50_16]|uniref:Uncharacterized protein n=1 Tax=Candidatus Uhrbacteria bacterium CG10_big_fil_rev_8_21_14_0_10_50_16 TaxID=1975039 RepID=A0A2H0RMV2_9BACT|nr:MAG: hypothetical protein COV06_00560 [Candidatus Uhrbacteria bacterium CG10_big_fil_rev_8_21_14_0_10_50_16]
MRQLRLLKCTTKYEETPWRRNTEGLKKVLLPPKVVWDGEVDETEPSPDGRWFYELLLDLPSNNQEAEGRRRTGSPVDGDEDYSYVLQEEKIGGAWAYAAHVVPWAPPEEEATADDDGDLTDPEAVRNAQAFQDAMEIAQA